MYRILIVEDDTENNQMLKEYLEEHTGMSLTVSKEDFIGGVRAVIHDKRMF